MSKTNKLKNGFSLIEIIIALSVLSVGILGLLQAFPRGTKIHYNIQLESLANNLAQEKQEELASIVYGNIPIGIIEDNERISSEASSTFYKFQRTTTVQLIDENFQPSNEDIGLKKITVTVTWPSSFDGSIDSTSLVTIISQR